MCRFALTVTNILTLVYLFGSFGIVSRAWSGPVSGVHGRVLETDDNGRILGSISGARVEFLDESGTVTASAVSRGNGYYQTQLIPGRYRYRVTASGFQDEDSGRGIEHALSEGYSIQGFTLVRGKNGNRSRRAPASQPVAVLYGRVQFQDSSGELQPVKRAKIHLRKIGHTQVRQISVTNSSGPQNQRAAYASKLPTASWKVAVSAPGFERLVVDDPVVLDTPDSKVRQDFVLQPLEPASTQSQGIRGQVLLAGARDVVDVKLVFRAKRAKGPYRRIHSVTSGQEFTHDLPKGIYQLAAFADGYQPAFSHPVLVYRSSYAFVTLNLVPLKETNEQQPTPLPERPVPEFIAANLIVAVKRVDANSRQITDLVDAEVRLQRVKPEDPQTPLAPALRQSSDQKGLAVFQDLKRGTYRIVASHQQHPPREKLVEVTSGTERAMVLLHSKRRDGPDLPPEITNLPEPPAEGPGSDEPAKPSKPAVGYVVYRTARGNLLGAEGVRVYFRAKGNPSVVSQERGRLEIALPDGQYTVYAPATEQFERSMQTASIRNCALTDYIYVTRKPSSTSHDSPPTVEPPVSDKVPVLIRILSDDGRIRQPLLGASITLSINGKLIETGFANARGEFSTSLPPGNYLASVSHRNYDSTKQSVSVKGPIKTAIALKSNAKTGIWVRVHDANNPRNLLTSAKVLVTGSTGAHVARYSSAVNRYQAVVPPGDYKLSVSHLGYQTAEAAVTVRLDRPTAKTVALLPEGSWTSPGAPTSHPGPVPADTRAVFAYRSWKLGDRITIVRCPVPMSSFLNGDKPSSVLRRADRVRFRPESRRGCIKSTCERRVCNPPPRSSRSPGPLRRRFTCRANKSIRRVGMPAVRGLIRL